MAIEQWSEDVRVAHLGDDPQFADDLEQLIRLTRRAPADAVLDFGAVSFVSSSNMADLLKLRQATDAADRRLVLCALSDAVHSSLRVTGIDKLFEMSDAVPLALAGLQMDE